MVLHFDGRYRSDFECKFLEQVEEELTSFWNSCSDNSVLVFPPLTPRYRFLIHQLVGVGSRLQTVSIGQGRQRRTVVYFATKREPEKMAQPPSTSQRTFFGRGRGRRPKRPDQPLYVPGALRQAKLNQLKENKDVENSTNITENKEISKSNKNGNSSMHEEKRDRSSYNNELFRGVDSITEGTDGTSFINTNVQHTNTPSLLSESVNKTLQSKNKEPNRENMAENDKVMVVAISEKSRTAPVIEYDNTRQVKVEGEDEQVVRTEESTLSIDDQRNLHLAFGPESSNDGSDCNSDVVVNCGISQTLSKTAMIDNDSARCVDDSLLTYVAEKSDGLYESEKPLVENIALARQNSGLVNSKTDCGSVATLLPTEKSKSLETGNQSSKDVPSLEANGDTILVEQSMENKEESEANETADCSLVNIVSDKKVEQERDWSGNTVTFQSDSLKKENSEILPCSGSGPFGHKEEQEHGITHPEDVSHTELTGNQLQMLKEEVVKETELRTSKVTLMPVCENIISQNNPTVTLGNDQPPSSTNEENLVLECSVPGHVNSVSVMDEKVHAMSEKTEAVSVSIENVGELETEQQKTSKKKKVKKDKGKDLKEDKVKSKEKGEKKRKKEKKGVKDKSDKEEKLDSEMQFIKEENKSKTKEDRSAKQQDKKGLSKCDIDTGKELTGESCGKSNDIDDDDDNWETIFDESGDCLNADYLEELSRLTGISNPEVQKTQFDYYSFKPQEIELDDEEFGHIVEIYNFSSELKTQDLMQALSSFRSKGFDIKWVDDTHALAVFASCYAAKDAIKLCSGPLMKLRPVSEGTLESKRKAHHCFEFLHPYRERPQTSKLLADRLVTGALGMRSKMTREERVKEREKLKEAKSKRDQEKTQKAQIWGD